MRSHWKVSLLMLMAVGMSTVGCGSGEMSKDQSSSTVSSDIVSSDTANSAEGGAAKRSGRVVRQRELHPVVVIETSLGSIRLKLDAEKAPITVQNFLAYVVRNHYDGTIFHQVDQATMILGGGYTPELEEKSAEFPIRNEAHNGLKNMRGTISMARPAGQIDSSTCQFFINLADNDFLDHRAATSSEEYGYCVFGEVVEGIEVLEKISTVEVHDTEQFDQVPVETVLIKSVKRVR